MVLKDYGSGKERVWVYNIPVKVDKQTIGDIYIESKINDVYNQLNINQIFIVGTSDILFITVSSVFYRPNDNQTVEMSKGNYTQRVKIYGNDEIGELALAFNNLSKRVQEAQAIQKVRNVVRFRYHAYERWYSCDRSPWTCTYCKRHGAENARSRERRCHRLLHAWCP